MVGDAFSLVITTYSRVDFGLTTVSPFNWRSMKVSGPLAEALIDRSESGRTISLYEAANLVPGLSAATCSDANA